MPSIFHRPISRKQFLRCSAGLLGALSVWPRTATADDADTDQRFRLALLSDTHIPQDPAEAYRNFAPVENLKQIVPQIAASNPAGAIVNGDAARLVGFAEDYRMLKELLQPLAENVPVFIGLGNHDDRKNFLEVFADDHQETVRQSVNGKNVLIIEHSVVRSIVLDSLLYVDKVAGLLGKSQRKWLARYLTDADNRPTILFVHHTLGDGDGELLDVDRLFRIVEPHKNVKAIFYGHSHEYAVTRRDDLHLVNLPAVGYNFDDSEPVGWVSAVFDTQGADLTLHAIGGNMSDDGKTTRLDW